MIQKRNYKECMVDMISNNVRYEKIFGIFLKELGKRNWYEDIGKFVINNLSDNDPIPLHFYYHLRIDHKDVGIRKKDVTIPNNVSYQFIGIDSVHSLASNQALNKAFGKPLFHKHFGEGFSNKSKSSYASYFLKINGINFHIGYDHRGTNIEVEQGTNPEEIFECLKTLYKGIWKEMIYQKQYQQN